jgi:drug/metabolite transporter (DMT)-like permease
LSAQTAIALPLALASTTLTNVAYLREHDAAAALPALSLRRPLHSAQALLTDRSWLIGFALESAGFALYVAALALAPLALVQSIAAGGIGVLALASARIGRRRLGRHELAGVLISMAGLLALAVSLARRRPSFSGSPRPPQRLSPRSGSGGNSVRSPSPRASPVGCSSRSATSR